MRLANMRNGLAWEHDDICNFQSNHGHHMSCGYFRIDAMPYRAVVYLLQGDDITLVDATRRYKVLTDALRFGVPTWCAVFNRAIKEHEVPCSWFTKAMQSVAYNTRHRPLVQSIRKLVQLYGAARPAIIGENVHLECHQGFEADDQVEQLALLARRTA